MTPSTSAQHDHDPARTVAQVGDASGPELGRDLDERGLAVLGMVAYSELAAFSRLASDAAKAPALDQRLELSRLAGVALERLDEVGVRIGELGGDLQPVMAPFAGVLVEFDRRTV